ncbi:MAG: hypothetical protein AAGA30_15020, partial [Planctomycetota bacterium]
MNTEQRPQKFSIRDLFVLTFGFALCISGFQNYPGMWGSRFWIVVTTAIVCSSVKQIWLLIQGQYLPFEKSRWDIRIAWITIRFLGIAFLSLFLIAPSDNRFSVLSEDVYHSDFSIIYSNSII